jgi:endonuclease/exonuclease/phosphatase family metal-dependent hydrolase
VCGVEHDTAAATDAADDGAHGTPRWAPQVALISRLPLAAAATTYPLFPPGVALPEGSRDADRFARAPLHVPVQLADGGILDVLVIHLKSKRPDYRNGETGADALQLAHAHLRSLVRRGTEAVGLRTLLSSMMRERGHPCLVMGDFNDTLDAVTTAIVQGEGPGDQLAGRLFDSQQLQLRQDQLRHSAYTIVHEGRGMTIDHVLLSEDFHPASPKAIGAVLDVCYLNDHLLRQKPEASDHGQVLVRLRFFGSDDQAGTQLSS